MAGRFGTWRVSLVLGLIPDIEDLHGGASRMRARTGFLVFSPLNLVMDVENVLDERTMARSEKRG